MRLPTLFVTLLLLALAAILGPARSTIIEGADAMHIVPTGTAAAVVNDWPQWKGPDRSGVSAETGLLKEWPKSGPPVVWSIAGLGKGYGTVAILADRIYVQGLQGKDSVVFCLNRANGRTLWTKSIGSALEHDMGNGPRGTPTV